jgi:hypothetical protein
MNTGNKKVWDELHRAELPDVLVELPRPSDFEAPRCVWRIVVFREGHPYSCVAFRLDELSAIVTSDLQTFPTVTFQLKNSVIYLYCESAAQAYAICARVSTAFYAI